MGTTDQDVFARLCEAVDAWAAELEAVHGELETRFAALRRHAAAREAAAATETLNALREELAARDARIAALEREVAEACANAAARETELRQQAAALRQELEELRARLDARDSARAAELEELLAEERDHAGVLEARLNRALAEAAELDNVRSGHAAALEELERLRAQQQPAAPAAPAPAAATAPDGAQHIPAFDAKGHKRRMGEILVDLGVMTHEQLMQILDEQIADPQRRFGALAVEHGHTGEELVARILAAQNRLTFIRLCETEIDTNALSRVAPQLARTRHCVPIALEGDRLRVAMANPLDLIAVEDIEIKTRLRVEPVVATLSEINAALETFYGGH